jgi:hypothetical protein
MDKRVGEIDSTFKRYFLDCFRFLERTHSEKPNFLVCGNPIKLNVF